MSTKQTDAVKNLEAQLGDLSSLVDTNTPVKKTRNTTQPDEDYSEDEIELEKMARERDAKLLEYRREQYQKFKATSFELVLKPMIMAASVAFGLSLGLFFSRLFFSTLCRYSFYIGYSMFDFVALRLRRSK